jgi:uncharacterized membrane protein
MDGVIPSRARALAFQLFCVALLVGSMISGALAAPMYNIISLGVAQTGDTTGTGQGVSPNGTYVVGFSSTSTANHALIWTQGTGTQPLPNLPGRAFNSPTGVNNNGVAAGTGATTFFGSNPLPVLWKNGQVTQLPLPGGQTLGRIFGINLAETTVGSVNGGTLERASIFTSGGSNVIPQSFADGGPLVTAYAINDNGRIVGQGWDPTNAAVTRGWYLDPGDSTAHDIGALTADGHNSAIAFGVSSNGKITGTSSLNSGSGALPFIYDTGTGMHEIPLPTGTTTGQGRGVNASGWVVGNSSSATSIPFLYDGTQSYRLQDLIAGGGAGWDLVSGTSNAAFSISDNGIITGRGLLNGVVTGYVMVPVPEPTSLAILILATPLAVRRRNRR